MTIDTTPRRSARLWLAVAIVCAAAAGASASRQMTSGQPPLLMSSTAAKLLLALDRLQADRWYPPTREIETAAAADHELIRAALSSPDAMVRRIVVRGIGRFENPADLPRLTPFLNDVDPSVRREAANAIVMSVEQARGADVVRASAALYSAAQFDAVARLHYEHDMAQRILETLNPNRPANILFMLRRDRTLRVTPSQLETLGELARPLRRDVPANRDALEIVFMKTRPDPLLVSWAAQYQCPPPNPAGPVCGWPIRYLGVGNLVPLDLFLGPMLSIAARDAAPEVQIMALRKLASVVSETKSCAPMIDALSDAAGFEIVRQEAIDLMNTACVEKEDISRLLEAQATDSGVSPHWSLAAHAIERLALIEPPKASTLIAEFGSTHFLWPLRAASARAALTLRDRKVLRRLASDDEPNVRAEALTGLLSLGDDSVTPAARSALSSTDDRLVTTAVGALRGTADREGALVELVAALRRLTEGGRDTSRIPRLAILDCLRAWAPPVENVSVVRPYVDTLQGLLRDFDPSVAAAAADVIGLVIGERPVPRPTHRPIEQPTEDELRRLPLARSGAAVASPGLIAFVSLQNGVTLSLRLLPDEAPIAVARFVRLARNHYFDNQMLIYQASVLMTASGGSPGANDDSGAARFQRDEIGIERHTTGAVGLFTHGRDTGDARFFVDLSDQPGFDLQYTIFARIAGMTPRDPLHPNMSPTNRLLEGGTISGVQLQVR